MRLVEPRDPTILRALEFGTGGNHPPTRVLWLCQEFLEDYAPVEDWNREQVGKALSRLADQQLCVRPPPDTSGLYRLSNLGKAALVYYERTGETEFSAIDLINVDGFEKTEFDTYDESQEYDESGRIADLLED